MGIENPVHLLFIAIVALIVLGPRRLPELTRAVGRGVREFREAIGQQGSSPDHVIEADSEVDEELAPGHAAIGPEPAAVPVDAPAASSRPAPESDAVGAATVDPAQPVRSGDAPDRRPL
jgi:sec-independent protein translocase protein TatA